MFCLPCSKKLGTTQPEGAHTVTTGECKKCGNHTRIWPTRHFRIPQHVIDFYKKA